MIFKWDKIDCSTFLGLSVMVVRSLTLLSYDIIYL